MECAASVWGMRRTIRYKVGAIMTAGAVAAALIAGARSQTDEAAVIRGVDAAVRARFEGIAGYTVTERYTVYRGSDETHPAAAMTVKTTYRKDSGKSYNVLSQSGSAIILKFGLTPLLENEKRINDPANRESSWLTSANYDMKLKSGQTEQVNGHECLVIAIEPKHKAPNLLIGTLWVDARSYTIVRIEGTASKRPSIWTGPPLMSRDYAVIDGFSEATRARAVSDSTLFGRSVVTIDYDGYQIERSGQR